MYLEPCTKDQLREFYAEFGATEESVSRDVEYLISWMEQEPHLPNVKDTDLLSNFLLRGKNSIERTKKLIENYYTARALMPDFFANRDLKADYISDLRKFTMFLPLPKLTPDGHRIMVFQIFNKNVEKIPPADHILRGMQIVFDLCLKIDKVRGTILIYDFENASASYITSLVTEFKKLYMVQNKINPLRYNKIYLLNVSSVVQPIINIASIFIKKQFYKVEVWKKPTTQLCEVLPKECLPKDFGGTERSFKELAELFHENNLQFRDWLLADQTVTVDLTKKPHNCKTDNMLSQGTEGSFRKLCID